MPLVISKIFLGGLSFDSTQESIKAYFSKYGEVLDSVIMREQGSMRSRGFGFVTLANSDAIATKRAVPRDQIDQNPLPSNQEGQEGSALSEKCFIGGIHIDATDELVAETFSKYGKVVSMQIMRDRVSGVSRGFGFLSFEDPHSTELAIRAAENGDITIMGRRVRQSQSCTSEDLLVLAFSWDASCWI
eukprot:jgi/Hompol1/2930/HPOL_001493-RA